MIEYKFGDIKCKLDFDDFLSITTNVKKYKSDFNSFSDLYEFIDKNKNEITHLFFDNNEYFLEKGILHNLYGPSHIRFNDKNSYLGQTKSLFFYINGKLVHDNLDDRGCKKLESFQTEEIFFYKELTDKEQRRHSTNKYYRAKEGVDYIKTIINLDNLIKKDQRNKKLKKISTL
jgi:hypothetical protein